MTRIPYFVYGADFAKGPGRDDYKVLFSSADLGCDANVLNDYCNAMRKEPSLPTLSDGGDAICDVVGGVPMVIGAYAAVEDSGRKAMRCAGVRLRDVIEGRPDSTFVDTLESWSEISRALRPVAFREREAFSVAVYPERRRMPERVRDALRAIAAGSLEDLARLLLRVSRSSSGTVFSRRRPDAIAWCRIVALLFGSRPVGLVSTSAGTEIERFPGNRLVFTDARELPAPMDVPEERDVRALAGAIASCRTNDAELRRVLAILHAPAFLGASAVVRQYRDYRVWREVAVQFLIAWAMAFVWVFGVLWLLFPA